MKNGRVVGTARVEHVTKDEILGMIILGKCPPGALPGNSGDYGAARPSELM
jgi:D-xylose transport system ATP-binding protein